MPMPYACTIKSFSVTTTANQTSSGSLQFDVLKNGASQLTLTILAVAVAGTYSVAGNAAFAINDNLSFSVHNNSSTSNSATLAGYSVGCQ